MSAVVANTIHCSHILMVQSAACGLESAAHGSALCESRCRPGPQKYAQQWPFGLRLKAFDHYFAYFWGPDKDQEAPDALESLGAEATDALISQLRVRTPFDKGTPNYSRGWLDVNVCEIFLLRYLLSWCWKTTHPRVCSYSTIMEFGPKNLYVYIYIYTFFCIFMAFQP